MHSLPIRILIVEDNPDDEILLLRQLKQSQLHHQIRVISDGGIALDYLTCDLFPCENLIAVFLDLNLPTVSGIELLQGIRSNDRIKHLPVIVMTSSNSGVDLKKCQALGVSSYVTKPVSFSAFTKAVADTFHTRRESGASYPKMPENQMKLKPPVKQIVTSDFADVPDEKFSELLEAIKECPDQFEEPKHAKESKSKSTSKTRPDSMPRGN